MSASATQEDSGSSDPSGRQPNNPDDVPEAVLSAAKHANFDNEELKKWTTENIRALSYKFLSGAFESKRQDLQDAAASNRTEVVLVTQGSTSRLGAFQKAFKAWGGPASFAVYIEFEEGTAEAGACRERVLLFLYTDVLAEFPLPESTPPLSISFLHTLRPIEGASCNMPVAGEEERIAVAARKWEAKQPTKGGHGKGAGGVGKGSGEGRSGRRLLNSRLLPPVGSEYVEHYDALYPVNALRNLAWSQVPDGLFVFLLDVDFVPTEALHTDLTSGRWQVELERMRCNFHERQERETLVVSAYERRSIGSYKGHPAVRPLISGEQPFGEACANDEGCELIGGIEQPRTRASLKRFVRDKRDLVVLFQSKGAALGQGCYAKIPWLDNEDPSKLMDFEYARGCEPYVIGLSEALPRYDERFRGRYQDKIEQLKHMSLLHFKFRLLPDHFVLHLPHPKASGGMDKFHVSHTAAVLIRAMEDEVLRNSMQTAP